MNRRTFIASLIATATLDPERLLWVPGKKTVFVPSVEASEFTGLQARYFDEDEMINLMIRSVTMVPQFGAFYFTKDGRIPMEWRKTISASGENPVFT